MVHVLVGHSHGRPMHANKWVSGEYRQTSIRMNVRWTRDRRLRIHCRWSSRTIDAHLIANSYSSINPSKIAFRRIEIRNYDKTLWNRQTHGLDSGDGTGDIVHYTQKSQRNFWCELFHFSHRLHSICVSRDRWRRRRLTWMRVSDGWYVELLDLRMENERNMNIIIIKRPKAEAGGIDVDFFSFDMYNFDFVIRIDRIEIKWMDSVATRKNEKRNKKIPNNKYLKNANQIHFTETFGAESQQSTVFFILHLFFSLLPLNFYFIAL